MHRLFLILASAALLAACETLPPDQRPTRAVQSAQSNADREIIGSNSPGFTIFSIEGPKDQNDTIHVQTFATPDNSPPATAPTQPAVPEIHGTIDLVPQGTHPTPAKP